MNWHLLADIVSLIFIGTGAFLALSAAVGIVRFKNTLARVHVITKPQTLGLLLTVTGTIIRLVGHPTSGVAERGDIGILILLMIFALLTSPVTAQRTGRVARREGLYGNPADLTRNEAPGELSKRSNRQAK